MKMTIASKLHTCKVQQVLRFYFEELLCMLILFKIHQIWSGCIVQAQLYQYVFSSDCMCMHMCARQCMYIIFIVLWVVYKYCNVV